MIEGSCMGCPALLIGNPGEFPHFVCQVGVWMASKFSQDGKNELPVPNKNSPIMGQRRRCEKAAAAGIAIPLSRLKPKRRQ